MSACEAVVRAPPLGALRDRTARIADLAAGRTVASTPRIGESGRQQRRGRANGVAHAVTATGTDSRAIEAAVHSHAALPARTRYRIEDNAGLAGSGMNRTRAPGRRTVSRKGPRRISPPCGRSHAGHHRRSPEPAQQKRRMRGRRSRGGNWGFGRADGPCERDLRYRGRASSSAAAVRAAVANAKIRDIRVTFTLVAPPSALECGGAGA